MSGKTTTSTNKNYYGSKRRGKTLPKTKNVQLIQKVVKTELARKEEREVERKYLDNGANISVSTSGDIQFLSGAALGNAFNNHIGVQAKATSLQMRYQISVQDAFNMVRVIIFRFFDGTTPVPSDILNQLTSSATLHPLSLLNMDNRKTFQVLFDNTYVVDTDDPVVVDKFYIEKNMYLSWKEDNSRDVGHIYMLSISDSAISSHPTLLYESRLRFMDQ